MVVLSIIVAAVFVRTQDAFFLNDAYAKTEKGKTGRCLALMIKARSTESGKVLLRALHKENKLVIVNTFFCSTQKWCAPHIPKRQSWQGPSVPRLQPNDPGRLSIGPLHKCTIAFFEVSRIRSNRSNIQPRQMWAKVE